MSVIRDMINKKKEMIAKKKNATDAGQSKVVGMTESGARIIENGEDEFTVSEVITKGTGKVGYEDDIDTYYDYLRRTFTVKDQKGHSKSLSFELRTITREGSRCIGRNSAWFDSNYDRCSARYGGVCDDINNINQIRYYLKDDLKASYFLDKFVIVTPEERKAYQEYFNVKEAERKQKIEARKQAEKQAARVEKIRARQEKRDSRKQAKIQKKEQKIQAKAKLAEEAEKKALEKKIEEKFFGRK